MQSPYNRREKVAGRKSEEHWLQRAYSTPGCQRRICIAEKEVGDKAYELTVLPYVLASLWINGGIVSVNAMGTHRNIVQQIFLQGSDYLMLLKDNRSIQKELAANMFKSFNPASEYMTEGKGHGRVETRTCSDLGTRQLEKEGFYEKWPGLRRIIKVSCKMSCGGKVSKETIYYLISSVQCDKAYYFAWRIQTHWGIENKLRWHLDVTLKEDRYRVRSGNEAVNFSALRKYVLEMFKRQSDKLSLKRRRKRNVCLILTI